MTDDKKNPQTAEPGPAQKPKKPVNNKPFIDADPLPEEETAAAQINIITQEAEKTTEHIKDIARDIISITNMATLTGAHTANEAGKPIDDLIEQTIVINQARRTIADILPNVLLFSEQIAKVGRKFSGPLDKQAVEETAMLIDRLNQIRKNYNLFLLANETEGIEDELAAELKKPKYKGKTLEELYNELEKNPRFDGSSLFEQAIRTIRINRLPQLKSDGIPKYYISPNTALSNALEAIDGKGELIGAGPVDIPVLNVGGKNEVTIYALATFENMENVTYSGKPFSEYDRTVHDAVVSLFADRKEKNLPAIATPDIIYRIMTHKTESEYVGRAQREEVEASIDKMRYNIRVKADATAEIRARGIERTPDGEKIDSYVIDNFILSADKHTVTAGGKKTVAYTFNEPILYNYARLTGQLFTVPGKMLDIKAVDAAGNIEPTSLPNTGNRIAVRSYLLRRIQVMRHDEQKAADAYRKYMNRRKKASALPVKNISDFRKQQRTILFSTIFNATEISTNSQTEMRKYVFAVLDYWTAMSDKRHAIKGYKKRRKGKSFDAVIIDV